MKMKLYTYYTPSHAIFKDRWFLPSLKDDYELALKEFAQVGNAKQQFGTFEFNKTMGLKVNLIIDAIKENWNNLFLYSDIDVQFFHPTKDLILKAIKDRDMVIQLESCRGTLCPGFFAARGNKKNLKLWQDIRDELLRHKDKNDQDILNELLLDRASGFSIGKWKIFNIGKGFINRTKMILGKKKGYAFSNKALYGNPYNIKWDYLPMTFFCSGHVLDKCWEPGMDFAVPADIVMHHANWTIGIENKIALLEYVRNSKDPLLSASCGG